MILVDSNVIIYYFNGVQKAEVFLTNNIGNMAISTLTISEVLFKPNSSEKEIENINLFLKNNFQWIDVSREIFINLPKFAVKRKPKHLMPLLGQRHYFIN